jgi:hypothetical protein
MKVSCIIWDDRVSVVVVGISRERADHRIKVLVAAALRDTYGEDVPEDYEQTFEEKTKVIDLRSFAYGKRGPFDMIYADTGSAEKDAAVDIEEGFMWALPYYNPKET